jgi:hypothetical protein
VGGSTLPSAIRIMGLKPSTLASMVNLIPKSAGGTLTLNPDDTFVQKIHIHGETAQRHGQYELNGKEITLIDELGTRDGPYTLDI